VLSAAICGLILTKIFARSNDLPLPIAFILYSLLVGVIYIGLMFVGCLVVLSGGIK
jgi:hypothetical protein